MIAPTKTPRSDVVEPSKPRLLGALGPGLVTGAADDDPSGIATYAQAGAQFGFQMAWTMLLTYPLMVGIQSISARIGRTTGQGLAANMREHHSPVLLNGVVALLLIANICNIGADLGAMAESARLLLPAIPVPVYLLLFAGMCAGGQIFMHHRRSVAILKWLTLSLFAYVATLFVVHISWTDLVLGLIWPTLSTSRDFWLMVVAVLGTTISPYLFFWQASQEAKDTKAAPIREPLLRKPQQGKNALARIRLDIMVGMGISNGVALAIMATAAATFHERGVRQLDGAAQSAEALRPSPARWRSPCSPPASSARACCRCPCSPAQRPMRWAKRVAGPSGWQTPRARRRHSRRPFPWPRCSVRWPMFCRSTRSRHWYGRRRSTPLRRHPSWC